MSLLDRLRRNRPAPETTVDVPTTTGMVRGLVRPDCLFFGGIPFAEPPVGPLRFAAPVRRRPWSGVFDARRPAKAAPQRAGLLTHVLGIASTVQSEDCLHATVWTPTVDPSALLPVIVFLHGGSFEAGSPANPYIDAGAIVARGDVVFVNLGYRLGVTGFLSLPGRPENRGLLDQVAGLAWVKENIRRFGGDPDAVTLVGSSAGATCTAAIVARHGRDGLFRSAVMQSGSAEASARDEEVRLVRRELLVRLGRPDVRLARMADDLEALPIEELVEAQRTAVDHAFREGVLMPLQLVRDAATMPELPLAAIRAGKAPGIDLLAGTTRDELRLWSLDPAAPVIDSPESLARCTTLLLGPGSGAHARAVAERYAERERRRSNGSTPPYADAFFTLATDVCFRYPTLRVLAAQARHATTYGYVFDWRSPSFGGRLGAPHAIDVPSLFGSHRTPRMQLLVGADAALDAASRNQQDLLLAFARTGDPSPPGFVWPAHDPEDRATVHVHERLTVECPAYEEEAELLAPVFASLYPLAGRERAPSIMPEAFRSAPPAPLQEHGP